MESRDAFTWGSALMTCVVAISLSSLLMTPRAFAQAGRAALERGIAQRANGDLVNAERSLRAALTDDEVSAFARLELGTTLAFARRFEEARALFAEALALDPASRGAMHGLAMVSLWEGEVEEARDRYQALVDLDETDVGAQRGLGAAELESVNLEEAEAALSRAVELGDDSARSLLAHVPYAYRTEVAVSGGVVLQDGATPRGGIRFSRAMTRKLTLGASFDSTVPRRDLGQAAHEGGVSLTIARAVTLGYRIGFGEQSIRHALVLEASHSFGALVLLGMVSPRAYHDGRLGFFFMAGAQVVAGRISVLGQVFRLDEQGTVSATTGALSLLASTGRRFAFRVGASVTKAQNVMYGANASAEVFVLPRLAITAGYAILVESAVFSGEASARHDISVGLKMRFAR